MSFRKALLTTLFWILCALCFNLAIYVSLGSAQALNFLTGYLVEYALSVDNLFVILTLFTAFQVPKAFQPRVLFWGIFGALAMRALFILTGIEMLKQFHSAFYIFGLFLVVTGIKTGFAKESNEPLEKGKLFQFIKRILPFTSEFHGSRFFIKQAKKWVATPLFLTLLFVELTDFMFALDSIPAILGITTNPFIVITSNIFAILGLRSLYFVLENLLKSLHYLKYALALILCFVGTKMIVADFLHISTLQSLLFILVTLTVAIAASFIKDKKK